MSQPKLFTPLRIRNLELDNRIVIAPMCQYSAEEGCMNDWHTLHLGQLALSGAGLLTIEAAAVSPEGRITYADVGLYDDKTEEAMGRVLDTLRKWSDIPVGIQLAHAGRKASTDKPWENRGQQIPPDQPGGWQTLAPSAVPYSEGNIPPTALDSDGLAEIRNQFAQAAKRAARLNIDLIQIHAAHGYLLHQFLSPLSNQRTDNYGGSLENRARFPLEIVDAVREAFPSDKAISVRISGTDWVEGGFNLEEAVEFSRMLEARGVDVIHVSSGGLHPAQKIEVYPGYQVPLARAVKAAVNIPVVAVGLITEPEHAESIVASGDADFIAIARGALYNPRWPWHAAAALGAQVHAPDQYLRCQPHTLKNLFKS
ncbi:NADH:flavin oxidoreductase/NADH oxidase [Leclercia adecarboxylata]|uniref:NADH:flavin oxidoreductase/NADH oxidase n=1 Tax=Leclercia adecarboxylata TaxID=83655 RepID=UPI002DB72DB0|nr:NADH:flavin oxidoreductase/NADH oxidase [Leclercia adecarboxylata]MEB6379023.1 NADH:flavin oxidoreductase/NADH oxidase [Leclercia adecarboxylata]